MPAELTGAMYDPIRDHLRFKALVAARPWP